MMRRMVVVMNLVAFLALGGAVFFAVSAPPTAAADGSEDTVGLVNSATGEWHLTNEQGLVTSFFYGNPGDVPIMGDWDCDGVDTPGLFRQLDGFVYLRNSNTEGIADIRFFFGNPGDFPLAGDFNGDGCDTVSIYRPAEGRFFVINKLGENDGGLGAAETNYVFGNPGDKPFVGDFDGDEVDTVGLHRESTGLVYFRNTHTEGVADSEFIFGDPGDRFVSGDWNTNGIDSPGLFRPASTTFFFRFTNSQGVADSTFEFGSADWLPVSGSFALIGGTTPTTSTTTSTTTGTPTTTTTMTTPPSSAIVQVRDNSFSSQVVTIAEGGTVTWAWVGINPHSTTSGTGSGPGGVPDGNWDSGIRTGGPNFSHSATFSDSGTYTYFCQVHTGMTGTVTVISP